MEQIPITTQGYEALKKDLERLKTIERPENIKAIETARAMVIFRKMQNIMLPRRDSLLLKAVSEKSVINWAMQKL